MRMLSHFARTFILKKWFFLFALFIDKSFPPKFNYLVAVQPMRRINFILIETFLILEIQNDDRFILATA